jgi:hypothetical protein
VLPAQFQKGKATLVYPPVVRRLHYPASNGRRAAACPERPGGPVTDCQTERRCGHICGGGGSVGDLSRVRRPIEHAWHAPGTIYHSPELYRLGRQYFRTDWLFVGRASS